MASPRPPVFLARPGYRQRRLRDALRLVPVAGAVLWMVPLAWPRGAEGQGNGGALIYIFGVWALLILAARLLVHYVRPDDDASGSDG